MDSAKVSIVIRTGHDPENSLQRQMR